VFRLLEKLTETVQAGEHPALDGTEWLSESVG
jgi:hypothetical protein